MTNEFSLPHKPYTIGSVTKLVLEIRGSNTVYCPKSYARWRWRLMLECGVWDFLRRGG